MGTDVRQVLMEALGVQENEIEDIMKLKKGMTNNSLLFSCRGQKYIVRIPGEGTEELINREQEYEVYSVIKDKDICDKICYINSVNGYKVTQFIENARTCNPKNMDEVTRCMGRLREIHRQGLKVEHTFDIFGEILHYEALWRGEKSCYQDYEETKKHVWELQDYIREQPKQWGLAHIDAVPDNFLIYENETGNEEIRLIDWEYAGMQDVHVDIAMFAIYAMYSREQVEGLIDAYFKEGCEKQVRRKIYAYIAACGLLWSNWCEYKRQKGVVFGDYSLRQYQYAKEYYQIWKKQEIRDK